MTTQGRFELHHVAGVPVVEVIGELDLTNAGEFESVLERAAETDRRLVVVALGQASYFDSKGVHVLLRFTERLSAGRQRLLVVAPEGTVPRRILDIVGLAEAFPVFDSIEDAVRHAT